MKVVKISIITLVLATTIFACRNEALSPYLVPESALHGFGQFVVGSTKIPTDDGEVYSQSTVDKSVKFDVADLANAKVNFQVQAISVDKVKETDAIELYLSFNESWVDSQNNPRVQKHGGVSDLPNKPDGTLWKTLTGVQNRTPISISITPNDVYEMFKNAQYTYGTPNNIAVFSANNPNGDRSVNHFLKGDVFEIRWRIKSKDGLYYGTFSPNVCADTKKANCYLAWKAQ